MAATAWSSAIGSDFWTAQRPIVPLAVLVTSAWLPFGVATVQRAAVCVVATDWLIGTSLRSP